MENINVGLFKDKSHKAYMAQKYPPEVVVGKYILEYMHGDIGPEEMKGCLAQLEYCCEQAIKALCNEMDVRGVKDTMWALGEVEKIKKAISKLINEYDFS